MKLTQRIVDEVKMMSIRDQVVFLLDILDRDDISNIENKLYIIQFSDILEEIRHFSIIGRRKPNMEEFIISNIIEIYRDKKINNILDEL